MNLHRMRRTFTGVLVLVGLGAIDPAQGAASARELLPEEVSAAAQTWVRLVTADARPDAVVESVEQYPERGDVLVYIVRLSGGGYCLCGPNDQLLPVSYYSPHGIFDRHNTDQAGMLGLVAGVTRRQREWTRAGQPDLEARAARLAERVEFWRDLIAGRRPARMDRSDRYEDPMMMVLGLTALWDQHSPYNDQTPILTPDTDEHTVVGCVATAAAQIMYFWKWPPIGDGSREWPYDFRYSDAWLQAPLSFDPGIHDNGWATDRLRWTSEYGGRLKVHGYWDWSVRRERALEPAYVDSAENETYRATLQTLYDNLTPGVAQQAANFGGTLYTWSDLMDDHEDPPDSPGDAEVAEICFHLGVSMSMEWGVYGSSATMDNGVFGATRHFGYDFDARVEPSDAEGITTEIQWLRPVWMAGSGHSFVAFGYNAATDPDRQFRINNGWGYVGGDDGWYSIDESWPDGQVYVEYLAPQQFVGFVGNEGSGDGTPDDPYGGIEEALADVTDGTTIIFRAASDNTFAAPTLIVDRPLTLRGKDVTLRRAY